MIFKVKLDIEKTLLLQSAERTNLLRPDRVDSRLHDPETQCAVVRALDCICLLVEDAQALQERYGTKKAENSPFIAQATTVSNPRNDEPVRVVSVSRMDSFIR